MTPRTIRDATTLRVLLGEPATLTRAFLRSGLWDPARFVDRAQLSTSGEIHEVLAGGDFDAGKYDEERAARYAKREGFY